MPRDIAPLTRALDDATRGEQRDVYGLLAAWDQSIETALERGGRSRFQEVVRQYLEDVIDVVEDLLFVGCLHAPFEQDFPDFPQYWEPDAELDCQVDISDDERERLLAVIGTSIDPGRLRHFDDSYRFDLERAADEYGPVNDT